MGLDILSRSESDTYKVPGVSGAAAEVESPWRRVGLRSILCATISHSNIFQSVAFSSVCCSFQYMLMSCFTSPIALLYSTALKWCIEFCRTLWQKIYRTVLNRKVWLSKDCRWKRWLLTGCETDSSLIPFSSHWTPRHLDEGVRGSHAQTCQCTFVLEGTRITHYAWHLS